MVHRKKKNCSGKRQQLNNTLINVPDFVPGAVFEWISTLKIDAISHGLHRRRSPSFLALINPEPHCYYYFYYYYYNSKSGTND